jgi:hypothetical protein
VAGGVEPRGPRDGGSCRTGPATRPRADARRTVRA